MGEDAVGEEGRIRTSIKMYVWECFNETHNFAY